MRDCRQLAAPVCKLYGMVWYGIVEFNVPLDTVYVISKTGCKLYDIDHRSTYSGLGGGLRSPSASVVVHC